MKSREIKFDNIKGILILLVVFGHFLLDYHNYLSTILLKFIYLFHMPLFAFISGYFSNKKSKLLYLIYIFLVMNTFYMIFSYYFENYSLNYIIPYYSMWYLLSLFYWRIINKLLNISTKLLIITIIIAVLVGFIPFINNTFAISRTICFLPFYISGNLYKNNNKLLFNNSILCISIIALSSLLITFNIINMNNLLMTNYYNIYDFISRIIIIITSYSFITLFIKYTTNNKIIIINKFGLNSLPIFIFHRIIPILVIKYFFKYTNNNSYILIFLLISILTCILFSCNIFNKIIDKLVKVAHTIKNVFYQPIFHSLRNGGILFSILTIYMFFLPIYLVSINKLNESNKIKFYKKTSYETEEKINNSIKISFIGDLILLKKQIEYNDLNNINNYDYIFNDLKDSIRNSDYTIGILEGPIADKSLGYTNSNFDDNPKKLLFNFPIEFASSIKNSGIDLVNISNNHLLDKNIVGVKNTMANLDKINLDYTGAYLNKNDKKKNRIKYVNIKGVKLAVISYTYGINYHTEKQLLDNYNYLTSYLSDPESIYFKRVKRQVENDFKIAKKNNSDLIIVMPHMGTQFSHKQDYYQNIWNKIFVDNGANIILGDHSHAVQPLEYNRNTLIINSPGNFINSYLDYDGNLGAIVNVYIDKNSKKIVTSSIIPTIVQNKDGCYKTSIIDNLHKEKLSNNEKKIVDESNRKITKVMINNEISFKNSINEYYFFKNGYKRLKNIIVDENNIDKNSILYKKFEESKSITFIGDSITEGSKNGGYSYYEPIINYFHKLGNEKRICNISKIGATTTTIKTMLKSKKCNTDLYVIAIGTNNIRYKNEKVKKAIEYINDMNDIINKLNSKNIVIIAPFISNDDDIYFKDVNKKKEMYNNYDKELKKYCIKNNYIYVNINNEIYELMKSSDNEKYMLDYIHPNNKGIKFYSEKILNK